MRGLLDQSGPTLKSEVHTEDANPPANRTLQAGHGHAGDRWWGAGEDITSNCLATINCVEQDTCTTALFHYIDFFVHSTMHFAKLLEYVGIR